MTLIFISMVFVGLLIWVNVIYNREKRRRLKLSATEQKQLKDEDDADMQGYSF